MPTSIQRAQRAVELTSAPGSVAHPAALPFAEPERLRALHASHLLADRPSAACLELAQVAASLFHVPIVLITLVDKDRQHFFCSLGLEAQEAHRDLSFCAHVVYAERTMVVLNATKDERFCAHPNVVAEGGVRFYAGTPILSADGYCLGTLCLIDTHIRKVFGASKRKLLEALARIASVLMQSQDKHT